MFFLSHPYQPPLQPPPFYGGGGIVPQFCYLGGAGRPEAVLPCEASAKGVPALSLKSKCLPSEMCMGYKPMHIPLFRPFGSFMGQRCP